MAGTRISAGTPTSISGAEKVPIGTGSGRTTTTTQAIADLARITTLNGLGIGVSTALAINVGSAGAFMTFNGAGGQPSSLDLTNATKVPITLTTTGTSGEATYTQSTSTLNIPQYAGTSYSAGTGLTLTSTTFSVNTSQSISTLSNLTTNGIVQTSGGTGALSILVLGTGWATALTQAAISNPSTAVGDLLTATSLSSGVGVIGALAAGSAGSFLRAAGASTNIAWSTLILPNSATNNYIPYATSTNTWGESANLKFDGTKLTVGAANNIQGVTTNNNATAGNIGETSNSRIATGSAVSLTTATPANVTSVSLAAGDYWIGGIINFKETTSTVTARTGGITTTSATVPVDGGEGNNGVQSTVTSEVNSITINAHRISLASTTTVYLVAQATFSAGTCAVYGSLDWVRIR